MITPAAPTLEVKTDDPGPRVIITLSGLDGDYVTVYRVTGTEAAVVRGAERTLHGGSAIVVDYEAPIAQVSYQVEVSDDDEVSPIGPSSTVTVPGGIEDVWISDPLDPGTAIQVTLDEESLSEVKLQQDVERLTLQGRERPIAQFFGLKALEGVPLVITVDNEGDSATLQQLMNASPMLIRTPNHPLFSLLPRLLYCTVAATANWPGWTTQLGAKTWSLSADEVAPQALTVQVQIVTIQTYMDAYPLISNVMSAFLTIQAEMSNPPGGY